MMKHRYTAIADTPLLIRAKKSYFQSSDVSQLVAFPSQQILHCCDAVRNVYIICIGYHKSQ